MKSEAIVILLNDLQDINTLKKGLNIAKNEDSSGLVLYVYEKEHYSLEDLLFINNNSLDKEKIKKDILNKAKELGYNKEIAILVYEEDSEDRILAITKENKKYKIVIPYHKEITKRVVAKVNETITIIKNSNLEIQNIAIILDRLSDEYIKRYKDKNITLIYDANISYEPVTADPVIPSDTTIYANLLDIEESNFTELKNRYNLNGEFFVNGVGLLDYIKSREFDLIVIYKEIKDIIGLDSTYEELIDIANSDILIL